MYHHNLQKYNLAVGLVQLVSQISSKNCLMNVLTRCWERLTSNISGFMSIFIGQISFGEYSAVLSVADDFAQLAVDNTTSSVAKNSAPSKSYNCINCV
jgi:L-lactate utilization protein LutB